MSNGQNIGQAAQAAQQWSAGMGQIPAQPPTDMQTHVQRADEAAKRLCDIRDSLVAMTGRLYGEGQTAEGRAIGPRAAGLSSELTTALSSIDSVSEQIVHLVTRLSSFA